MTIFNEKEYLIGTAEYGANFWNAMRGIQHAYDKIHGGANGIINQKAILHVATKVILRKILTFFIINPPFLFYLLYI